MKLQEITSPAMLRGCSDGELQALAAEIREAIICTVARNGGHLASNLGVVETTIALHRVFDCPRDKIIFDVGHQCYAHKMLTGRFGQFGTLRQTDGLSGFPRREESEYDAFGAGHASTAISAALGYARARDMQGEDYKVVAVVGDGAMTGGMCYEALNDAGSRKTSMTVILNDNGMSISRNVGALSGQLTRMRVSRGWLGMKKAVSDTLRRVPVAGEAMHKAFLRIKNGVRNSLVRDKFFTSLGFRYFGPIDGQDLQGLERVLRRVRDIKEPVLLHVVTKKGSGFSQAEEKPEKYHGVSPFVMENGVLRGHSTPSLGSIAGKYVTELAKEDDRICVVTAAMTDSTGFSPFEKAFPQRLFDVGIAEEHAVTLAAGIAAGGMRPFVAIYETFLQRSFDQIIEDVCLQKLPVCFLMDRAGLGAEDGPTHHGVFGLSMLRMIPGLTVLSPRDGEELKQMILWSLTQNGPVAIRYPRGAEEGLPPCKAFAPGKWEEILPGKDAALLFVSNMGRECMDAANILKKKGIHAAVINASSVSPLDGDMLKKLSDEKIPLFTVEEHLLPGGFGSAVTEYCIAKGFAPPRGMLGLQGFTPHGSRRTLLERLHLDGAAIADEVEKRGKK